MKLIDRYIVVNENGTYYKETRLNPYIGLTILGILIAIWCIYGRNIIDFLFKLVGL